MKLMVMEMMRLGLGQEMNCPRFVALHHLHAVNKAIMLNNLKNHNLNETHIV